MKPTTITIYELFQMERRHLVPLFQRPYVWTRERQWEPLWRDIAQKADDLVANARKRNYQPRQHFLGAVVLSQIPTYGLEVAATEIIDGQQRLTTLQVILITLRDYAKIGEYTDFDEQLRLATRNSSAPASAAAHQQFKVWPTSTDRAIFTDVWNAGSPDALALKYPLVKRKYTKMYELRHPLVEAYMYFFSAIRSYVETPSDDNDLPRTTEPVERQQRLEKLMVALTRHLELVKIDLEEKDDPQVIFETLNARGEPLLPSDLTRNFVFLEATRQDEYDVERLYTAYWHPYDTTDASGSGFWKTIVRQGRLQRPRMDLFLFHYLAYRTESEIVISHLFKAFQSWWLQEDRSVEVELRELQRYSEVFKQLYSRDDASRLDVFGRRLRIMDTSTLYPLLLFLLVEKVQEIGDERDGILTDLESYLVRRMVCGFTSKNYNRIFLSMLRSLRKAPRIDRAAVQAQLMSSESDTARWPSDSEFRTAWLSRPAYSVLTAQRIVMVLEALEWQGYGSKQEHGPFPSTTPYSIEHLLPQNPSPANWPLGLVDETDSVEREAALHRREQLKHTFGNLTLVTQSLNSLLGNDSFDEKRKELILSVLRLNRYFEHHSIHDWNEARIIERGQRLFSTAVIVWPHPVS